jgi:hypothetical protein
MSFLLENKYKVSILMFSVSLLNLITGDICLIKLIFNDLMTLLLEVKGLSALRAGL